MQGHHTARHLGADPRREADGTAVVTWDTDEVSDSRVDYGTSPSSLTFNAVSTALVTSHGFTLTGLARNTTYYYRVRSADPAGNASTSPPSPLPGHLRRAGTVVHLHRYHGG